MNIIKSFLPINKYNAPSERITPKRICVHYTGLANSPATAQAAYQHNVAKGVFNNNPSAWTSSHFVVDYYGEIVQTRECYYMAYAASGQNKDTIHIEVCHETASGEFNETCIQRLAELVQYLMKEYGISADNVIRHYDLTGKLCPLYYVNDLAWASLKSRITGEAKAPLYRVQVGAFRVRSNAENFVKECKAKGIDAFIVEVTVNEI